MLFFNCCTIIKTHQILLNVSGATKYVTLKDFHHHRHCYGTFFSRNVPIHKYLPFVSGNRRKTENSECEVLKTVFLLITNTDINKETSAHHLARSRFLFFPLRVPPTELSSKKVTKYCFLLIVWSVEPGFSKKLLNGRRKVRQCCGLTVAVIAGKIRPLFQPVDTD